MTIRNELEMKLVQRARQMEGQSIMEGNVFDEELVSSVVDKVVFIHEY